MKKTMRVEKRNRISKGVIPLLALYSIHLSRSTNNINTHISLA